MAEILMMLKQTAYGSWVGTSLWGYAIFESIHLFGVAFLVGAISLTDLRLLGVSKVLPVTLTEEYLLPWVWAGFALCVFSGLSLFITDGKLFLQNPFFLSKIMLIVLAGLNASFFQFRVHCGVAQWDRAQPTPMAAKVCAFLSISFWFLAVGCGRAIAYPEMWRWA
jgi:hypothetical protein